jgi:hypothetical protein
MAVLVACEESQAVTIALRNVGIAAYSCDILDCSGGHPEWHIKEDVLNVIDFGWDAVIAFPPCTHIANSGARWFKQKVADGRQQQGIEFFMRMAKCRCDKVAVENPIGIMSRIYRKPDQIINPWQFGDSMHKPTCLWLKGLPKLVPTSIVDRGSFMEWTDKNTGRKRTQAKWISGASYCGDMSNGRGMARSKTPGGIARAMAEQWKNLLKGSIGE